MSDSEEELTCTPPTVLEAAKEATLELLPVKSKQRYDYAYNQFMEWRKEQGIVTSFSENTLLAYFGVLSNKICPTTLWVQYSMLRTTLLVNQNINIASYMKLKALLKRKSAGYKPKKSKTLTAEEINKFINQAPDSTYLLQKVILIIGISGACRKQELLTLKIDDIEDLNSAVLIRIPDTKTKKQRIFTVTGNFYTIYKKYAALRPANLTERRFFVNYQKNRCTKQPVGINKIGSVPKQIATYLGLKEPQMYTGHCYRRSSATILVDAGGDITTLKRHGGWQSTPIAESYIDDSLQNKLKVANTILNSVNESTTPAIPSSLRGLPIPSCSRRSPIPSCSRSSPIASCSRSSPIPTAYGSSFVTPENPPSHVSAVSEQNLHDSRHPVNFYKCSNNQITINIVNNTK